MAVIKRLVWSLLLLGCPLAAQQYIVPHGPPPSGAACTYYEETTWDNLTGWTQDSENQYSADATNDELDQSMGAFDHRIWIRWDTDLGDDDMCITAQLKDWGGDEFGLGLRMPSSAGSNLYFVESDSGGTIYWYKCNLSTGGCGSESIVASNAFGTALDAGDFASACVTGTGSSTVVTYWDHGASQPSTCRADWGTADVTFTDDPTGPQTVDTGTRGGLLPSRSGGGGDGSWIYDDIVIQEY